MKIKTFAYTVFVSVIISSCYVKKEVTTETLHPSEITIDKTIRNIIIVDRIERERSLISRIEKATDRQLRYKFDYEKEKIKQGLKDGLNEFGRYNAVLATEKLYSDRKLLDISRSEPLPDRIKDSLCERYSADAVLTLDGYSSEFMVTKKQKTKHHRDLATGQKLIEYYSEGRVDVFIKMSLFFADNNESVHEDLFVNLPWKIYQTGINQADIFDNDNFIDNAGVHYNAGYFFAGYLSPHKMIESRILYMPKFKKNSDFGKGVKFAEVGDWENAIKLWINVINSAKPTVQKRLALNIALAYEQSGDLDQALDWAKKAYIRYNFPEGKRHARQIIHNIELQKQVQEQLK